MMGEEGSVGFLMGNEAVARGAIEAGVRIVTGYPGTPSSEVIQTLAPLAKELGIRVEWSVNEKVAVDIAAGAAMAGVRCLVTMKSAGLNVASDSIMSSAYGDADARARAVARWLKKNFNLYGFVILRSSENNYHVVFNRSVTWEENMKIIGFASFMCSDHFKNHNVMCWAIMQMIKGSSTLRISTKFYKHRPRIIYKEGSQDKEIKAFREYREIFRRLQ